MSKTDDGACQLPPPMPIDPFKWKLFQVWVDTKLPADAKLSYPDYLYAAWLDGYESGYDHAY